MTDLRDIPSVAWVALAALIVAMAIVIHSVFPRYDYRIVDRPNSISVIVYDRWSGKFQRGTYNDTGEIQAMASWTPF